MESEIPTQRPHYKERVAHAEGYEIEVRFNDTDQWEEVSNPLWHKDHQHRIKKEVTFYLSALFNESGVSFGGDRENLRLTFNGETGELEAAKVIK